jgi:hypothetical protein
MEKHNILGKKAEASAALKEKAITFTAWVFILFCSCLVFYFSKIGLRALFLSSNSHFTLQNIEITVEGLPQETKGLVDLKKLEDFLELSKGSDNLFEIDLKEIQKKVHQNICIESANISFLFPDTLKVKIREKQPIARLRNNNLIATVKGDSKQAFILPPGREDIKLPIVMSRTSMKPGDTITDENVIIPLNFVRFNNTFRMSYPKANKILGHKDFASLEILEIQSIFLDNEDNNTLRIALNGKKHLLLAYNLKENKANTARLKILSDSIELGIRRACIAILENASVQKASSRIDARYSSTSTE